MIRFFIILSLLITTNIGFAQKPVHITLVGHSLDDPNNFIGTQVRQELEAILAANFLPEFHTVDLSESDNPLATIQSLYQGNTDLIIGTSFQACVSLSRIKTYSKPTILSIILDTKLQAIPHTAEGTSGLANFNYLEAPFDIARDFETLHKIKPFDKVAILVNEILQDDGFNFSAFLDQELADLNTEYVIYPLVSALNDEAFKIPADIDAAVLFPVLDERKFDQMSATIKLFTEAGLPIFSVLSSPAIELGAYAAYDTEGNLARIPRRVALNALKILEGQAAADLPVAMDHFTENLLINMEAARATRHFPSWELMSDAVLLNVTVTDENARTLNLQSAIAEGLTNNLGISIAQKNVLLSEYDVAIAKSNYLPQLDASATALVLDEATVRSSFGARGYLNFSAKANFSQLLLSEPAIANVAIQNLLLESEKQALRQNELDLIQEISDSYLGILQATALVRLRNSNVKVTRRNYDIAQAKEQVGYSGTNDVYRFESELALNNVDLNTAQAQLRAARFNLNVLLNRPVKEEFTLAEAGVSDGMLMVTNPQLTDLIDNPGDIEIFADFLVQEAFINLPELQQIGAAVAAQQRSLLSQNRAFYLPTIVLAAEYELPIEQYRYPEGVMPIDIEGTYNAAIAVQLPIFQGNSRRRQQAQTQVAILQLQDQTADLKNKLELQLRANLEIAGASFSNLDLSDKAVEASRKNFEIAQNSYQEGLLNITSLIDAQNALLQTEINAINAEYTFINDFLAVERAVGSYYFLALPQEQDAFFQRFIQFITNQQ